MDQNYKKYHRDRDYVLMESTFRNIFLLRFKEIRKIIPCGRVLEIGCSIGTFLQIFKENGYEVLGVEPSASYKLAQKRGIKVINSFFEQTQLPKSYFDLVILNHTLEHLDEPDKIIRRIHGLIKKNGYLYVDVPNAGGLPAKIMGKYWPYRLPTEHLWQFDKNQLFRLLKNNGFVPVFWKSRSGFFEYKNPLKEFYRKRFLIDLVAIPFSFICTMLNIGDSITIIARRK